eukprot:UN25351
MGLDRKSEKFHDTFLNKLGKSQAQHLNKWLDKLEPKMIITSPLSRAIQTTCIMRKGLKFNSNIIADPRVSETGSSKGIPENTGRKLSELQRCPTLNCMYDQFEEINFERIKNNPEWWNGGKDK